MSRLKRLIICNGGIRSVSRFSAQIRACSSSSIQQQKIPKISDNDLFKVIDEYDTRRFDRWSHKASHNAQKFALKRKIKLQEMLQQQDQYHPLIFSLLSAQTGSEILDILNNVDITQFSHEELTTDAIEPEDEIEIDGTTEDPTIHRVFSKAIRCCADLGEMDICWQIFENCKKDQLISNELYNTMMWVCMYNKRDSTALEKVFKLNKELEAKITEYNLQLNPRTYSTLINSCLKARKANEGFKILRHVEKNHPELLKHSRLVQAASRLAVTAGEIDKAEEIIDSISELDEKAWCRFEKYLLSKFLFKIAKRLSTGMIDAADYTRKAQKIFEKCVSTAIKYDVEIPNSIFTGMMDVYAANGDFKSCAELLRYMIDPNKKHKLYPAPSASTFECMTYSLIQHENNEGKWKKLNSILKAMERLDIKITNFGFYMCLFQVCGDDVERAKKFYNDMIDVDQIQPNMALLEVLFNVGVKQYENNKDYATFEQFVKWIIDEYSKHNIIPTTEVKDRWIDALNGR